MAAEKEPQRLQGRAGEGELRHRRHGASHGGSARRGRSDPRPAATEVWSRCLPGPDVPPTPATRPTTPPTAPTLSETKLWKKGHSRQTQKATPI